MMEWKYTGGQEVTEDPEDRLSLPAHALLCGPETKASATKTVHEGQRGEGAVAGSRGAAEDKEIRRKERRKKKERKKEEKKIRIIKNMKKKFFYYKATI